MLTRTRLGWISLLSALLFVVAASSPAGAQIHGVAPSVTSFGFGGSNNPTPGVAASVTSLGPNGYAGGPFIPMDCCLGPFVSPFQGQGFNGRRFDHHHRFPVGEMMPAYIPYAVPYPYPVPYEEYDLSDDYGSDVDSTYSRGVPVVYDRGPWYRDAPAPRHAPAEVPSARKDAAPPAASDSPAPVTAQPSTVLVYKDGHKTEVENYAIVGDTLFDFAGNRSHKILLADLDLPATRKTNDERGVDFQLPGQKAPSP